MLVHGKVLCKVPAQKQIIFLNWEEKRLYQEQFEDDLFSITTIADPDLSNGKTTALENPYDLAYKGLKEYIERMMNSEIYKILRRYHDEWFAKERQ